MMNILDHCGLSRGGVGKKPAFGAGILWLWALMFGTGAWVIEGCNVLAQGALIFDCICLRPCGERWLDARIVVGSSTSFSHSNNPPRGMCWTTTRFPKTSAWVHGRFFFSEVGGHTARNRHTSYILNKPELTFPQFGTPMAIECSCEECS